MQKLLSTNFNLSSELSMEIAERLYNKGLLSYPRTETTIFSKTINIRKLVEEQIKNSSLSDFAKKVSSGEMWGGPNNGNNDDKSHPPIHPVKVPTDEDGLGKLDLKVYDFIARHFLAWISKDATYFETVATF